jgi:hypothetical protein
MRLKQIDAALALRWQIEGQSHHQHHNMSAQQIQQDRTAVEEVYIHIYCIRTCHRLVAV